MEENQTPEQSNHEGATQVGHDIVMPSEPAEDPVITKERDAFTRFVQEQGEQIPANFKSAEDWFASLKEAQTRFTQGQQEIAALKQQYNETGVTNPNYDPQANEQPQSAPSQELVVDVSDMPDDLSITKPAEPEYDSVSQDDWVKWGAEIDKNGDLSDTTRKEVAKRLNADPIVVEQMVRGRLAMQKQAFNESSQVVGGADNLKRILKWAGESLPAAEIQAMNRALQGDASQSVLLGLHARYQAANPATQETQPEPAVSTPNAMQAGQISRPGPEAHAFMSENEMKAAISDPRYRTDIAFRTAVEERIQITSTHGYRQR